MNDKCKNCHDMELYPDEECPDCGRKYKAYRVMGRMKEEFIAQRERASNKARYIDDEYWYEQFKIKKHGKRTTKGKLK